jgi:peptidoglycan/LPS O-acetylase OafA/YrhL
MLIFIIGDKGGESGRFQRWLLVLGKYSLFTYVSQIAILQLMHRGLAHSNLGIGGLAASLLAAFALTIVSAEVVDQARPKSKVVDRFYKAVFA